MRRSRANGFTLRELLVVVTLIAIVLGLLIPAIRDAREAARKMSCSNNFKQVILAVHNYHAAYKQLPCAMQGTHGNANRLSGLIALTPFCMPSSTWEEIFNPQTVGGVAYPSMGPVPWDKNFPPWKINYWPYLCPSDVDPSKPSDHPFGRSNAVFCIGDPIVDIHKTKPLSDVRGMFAPRVFLRLQDILDGTSNTIALSEVATKRGRRREGQFAIEMPQSLADSPHDCLLTVDLNKPLYYADSVKLSDLGRGGNWADGAGGYALMQTILPPNSPSCAIGGTAEVDGIYSASSRHAGGCHVAMGDGAVHFVTDTIDVGDLEKPAPVAVNDAEEIPILSPYGVWGALGTRASAEADVGFDGR